MIGNHFPWAKKKKQKKKTKKKQVDMDPSGIIHIINHVHLQYMCRLLCIMLKHVQYKKTSFENKTQLEPMDFQRQSTIFYLFNKMYLIWKGVYSPEYESALTVEELENIIDA